MNFSVLKERNIMKKIVMLILLIVSSSVFAGWTLVSVSNDDDDDTTFFVDFQSIRKKGNKVIMVNMVDHKRIHTEGKYKFLSSTERNEYDCSEESIKQLGFSWYSENLKHGDVVYSQINNQTQLEPAPITPDSVGESLFNIACGKK